MKYTTDLIINAPLDRVVELYADPDSLKKWMIWLESAELLSGITGEVGAKTKLIYNIEGRKVQLVETIVANELPQEFIAEYTTDGAKTTNTISFEAHNATQTLFRTATTFEASRFTVKALAFLVPSVFKKQTKVINEQFKTFVEQEKNVVV